MPKDQQKKILVEERRLKPERLVVDGEKVVRVRLGHRSWILLFFVAWLLVWTFGCVDLVKEMVASPFEWTNVLKVLPFLAAEVFVVGLLLMLFFGTTIVTFRPSGGTVYFGVGPIGRTRRFTYPVNGELLMDSIETRSGRNRRRVVFHRIVVKSSLETVEPYVVYSSTDPGLIAELYDLVREVAVIPDAPQKGEDAAEAELEQDDNYEQEARDHALLAAPPPRHLTAVRDLEGRVHVAYRRIAWMMVLSDLVLIGVLAWVVRLTGTRLPDLPRPVLLLLGCASLVVLAQLAWALFGRRTITLDHGRGVTFAGVFGIGFRRRFAYGGSIEVGIAEGDMYRNGKRTLDIVLSGPDGQKTGICGSWPKEVKPYLAALLRHPYSVGCSV